MKIAVCKTGTVLKGLGAKRADDGKGESEGGTSGLMALLVERGHDVIYCGRLHRGSVLPDGVRQFQPKTYDLRTPDHLVMETADYQAAFRRDLDALSEMWAGEEPDVFFDQVGITAGRFLPTPAHPRMTNLIYRYCMPFLGMMGESKKPRVVIMTDTRHRINEAEWKDVYPELMPSAIFSQRNRERLQQSHGVSYQHKEVRAYPWTWGIKGRHVPPVDYVKPRKLCILMAHANVTDGYRSLKRDDIFSRLLGTVEQATKLAELGLEIRGLGWESTATYRQLPIPLRRRLFRKPVPSGQVMQTLGQYWCGIMVPPDTDWDLTTKVAEHVFSGCLPIFYGRPGAKMAYDGIEARVQTANSPYRVSTAAQLITAIKRVRAMSAVALKARVESMIPNVKPDFKIIEDYLSMLESGQSRDWARFGGTRKTMEQ